MTGFSLCPLHHQPGLATFLKALHQKKKKKERTGEAYRDTPPRDLPSSQVLTALGFPAPEEPSWSQLDEGNGLRGNGPSISQPGEGSGREVPAGDCLS